MFTLALIFAGTNAFGQQAYDSIPDKVPTNLIPSLMAGCTATELHPVQGEVYTYTVVTTPQSDIRWFVINNADLKDPSIGGGLDSIVGFNGVLPSGDAYIDPSDGTGDYIYGDGTTPIPGYDTDGTQDANGEMHTIDIAWKYFDGMQPNEVLLVAYATDSVGCTNNIAVYRIIPQPAFTIDIAVLSQLGDSIAGPLDPITGECVSPIESAIYASIDNESPNGTLTVDYGENWVYYIVNGANYLDSWMPEFQIGYADGTAPVVTASWAYLTDATSTTFTDWNVLSGAVGGTWTSADPVIANAVASTAGTTGYEVGDGRVPAAGGEAIVVRVRLDWGTLIEHDQAVGTLTFAANGIAYDGVAGVPNDFFDDTAFEDLKNNGTVGTDCEPDGFDNDVVDYQITKRPKVEAGTPIQEDKSGDTVN